MGNYKTPLRYPGGKQKLTPFIQEILEANDLGGGEYAEPYAGGAGVAIELLLSRKVSKVHLNDAAKPVYAFWKSVVKESEAFCRRIYSVSLSVEEWKKQKEVLENPKSRIFDLGFSFFFLNRCNRSGILSAGPIGGYNQDGNWKIDARFTRLDLIRRIEAIALFSKNIRVNNMDGEDYIRRYIPKLPENSLVYCDPPYLEKSNRLYLNYYRPEDHKRISKTIQKIKSPWIVSYDNSDQILSYYRKFRSFVYSLQYNAATAFKGEEVFIFGRNTDIPSSSKLRTIDEALSQVRVA